MDRDPFTDQGALLLAESDGCAVWQFHGRGGEGTMTVYQVLPGVMLSFNDFHMDCFESSFVPGRRMLAIDHCREGRMEYFPVGDRLAYTEAGDVKLDLRLVHTGASTSRTLAALWAMTTRGSLPRFLSEAWV